MTKKQIPWENKIVGSGTEDPEKILANPFNFRNHPKHQKEALTGVLNEIGWIQDVIINTTTGHLIDGHLRVELAMQKGEQVPVKYVELTEKQERIALASIDPISALAEQDQGMLDELVESIGTVEDDLLSEFLDGLIGEEDFEEAEEQGMIDDDEAPDVMPDPTVKPGDIWILGDHRLLCGDSLNIDDIMRLMDGEQADMLWIDPPYNVDYTGKTKEALKIDNDSMGDSEFRAFLRDLLTSCFMVMREGAPFYIAHADSEGYNFRGATQEAGFLLKQCLVWVKNVFVMGRQDYHWQHEPILYGWKPGAAHSWYGERNKANILDERPKLSDMDKKQLIEYCRELRNAVATSVIDCEKPNANGDHPTMKPVKLITGHIKNSSRRGDIIIDFCGGSGSTLIAAEKLGRRARICEISPQYAEVIIKRWQEFTGQSAVLEETGQTFAELSA